MSSNKDIIEAHYAAGDAGDLPGMLAPFADDIIWTEAAGFPLAGTYIGPAAVAEHVFGALQRDWDGYTVAIDELIDTGDTVIGLGTYSGTYRETGKSFQARVAHIWRLADGKAIRFEQITDTAEVLAAMS
jgi:ketosteroid isomerase-like protein